MHGCHISEVAEKASHSWIPVPGFKECTKEVKAATYTNFIGLTTPLLFASVWGPHHQGDINFEQVQSRATRYVYNDYTIHTPGGVTEIK